MATPTRTAPPDPHRAGAWLSAHVPDSRPPYAYEIVANGRSNLTYIVRDAGGALLVLRRPPAGPALPTAHDVLREHRLITALAPTAVPVPEPVAACDDPSVLGAPFYVMRHVPGRVVTRQADAEAWFDAPTRATLSTALVQAMAALHAVDVDAVGLGDLARRDRYVERQLKRWHGQLARSVAPADRTDAGVAWLAEAHDRLAAAIPPQTGTALVHGDFRLGNCVVGDDGTVRAVLDWETCTIGDPLADLAILLVGWFEAGDDDVLGMIGDGLAPTVAPGFLDRRAVTAAYGAARDDADLADLPYYQAFAWWRMACVLHAVRARYASGGGGGETAGQERMLDRARGATEQARRALRAAGLR